jgi:hypothetical protein
VSGGKSQGGLGSGHGPARIEKIHVMQIGEAQEEPESLAERLGACPRLEGVRVRVSTVSLMLWMRRCAVWS